jgi:biopolymer transport protein ExbB
MQFNFAEMWHNMGIPAIVVATVLVVMGMASLTVFVERLLTLRRSRQASQVFATQVAEDMLHGRFDAAIATAEQFKTGHLARVVRTGLATYRHAQQTADVSGLTPVDQTQRHMERYMEEISADLRRGLSLLASVGSTAPFVGLLGTVLGIISAFQGIAATGSGGLSSVSAGISEALIETALGLSVAIPAVLAFNYLSGRIGGEEMRLKNACGELLDTIEDRAERELQRATPVGRSAPSQSGTALRRETVPLEAQPAEALA